MLHLSIFSSLSDSCNFFIGTKNVRYWTERSDRVGVDLFVRLGVVILDVSELCGLAECWVIPVEIAQPSVLALA